MANEHYETTQGETEAERAEEARYWAHEDAREAAAAWAIAQAQAEAEDAEPGEEGEDDGSEW